MQSGAEIMKAASMKYDTDRPVTDRDFAEDYRTRLIEAHKAVFAIVDEARAAGFEISFASAPGSDGKLAIQSMKVMKVL
jgi:hypothetical protein